LFDDRGFAALVGSTFSLLALLAYTLTPTWLRYWYPPAALSVVIFIWALKAWPTRNCLFLVVASASALLNTLIK
jgi:hypothetical protein